jgi:hypothetical protein
MEQQIRDYLATRSGPLRVERLAPRVLGKEWRDLSPADKERIIREFRRCGFVQHAFPFWVRAKPRIALTEAHSLSWSNTRTASRTRTAGRRAVCASLQPICATTPTLPRFRACLDSPTTRPLKRLSLVRRLCERQHEARPSRLRAQAQTHAVRSPASRPDGRRPPRPEGKDASEALEAAMI